MASVRNWKRATHDRLMQLLCPITAYHTVAHVVETSLAAKSENKHKHTHTHTHTHKRQEVPY